MLSPDGHVSEGSGENIFLVIDGKLVTPATYNNILMGITRNTVIELAKNELGIRNHRTVHRPQRALYRRRVFPDRHRRPRDAGVRNRPP